MSKANRGSVLKAEQPKSGRKTCPVCKRSGIKAIYELEIEEKKYLVCKQCKAGIASGKLKEKLK